MHRNKCANCHLGAQGPEGHAIQGSESFHDAAHMYTSHVVGSAPVLGIDGVELSMLSDA